MDGGGSWLLAPAKGPRRASVVLTRPPRTCAVAAICGLPSPGASVRTRASGATYRRAFDRNWRCPSVPYSGFVVDSGLRATARNRRSPPEVTVVGDGRSFPIPPRAENRLRRDLAPVERGDFCPEPRAEGPHIRRLS